MLGGKMVLLLLYEIIHALSPVGVREGECHRIASLDKSTMNVIVDITGVLFRRILQSEIAVCASVTVEEVDNSRYSVRLIVSLSRCRLRHSAAGSQGDAGEYAYVDVFLHRHS